MSKGLLSVLSLVIVFVFVSGTVPAKGQSSAANALLEEAAEAMREKNKPWAQRLKKNSLCKAIDYSSLETALLVREINRDGDDLERPFSL